MSHMLVLCLSQAGLMLRPPSFLSYSILYNPTVNKVIDWIYVVYDHFYSSQSKVLWLLVGFFGILPHLSSMKTGYTGQVSLWSATCIENTFKRGLTMYVYRKEKELLVHKV